MPVEYYRCGGGRIERSETDLLGIRVRLHTKDGGVAI